MNWHVLPVNDLEPHEETTTCKCEPRVEHVNGNMVIIHNSFDGREGVEWANEILSTKKEQKYCCLDWQTKSLCDGNCHT